jgi:hypothetical protein
MIQSISVSGEPQAVNNFKYLVMLNSCLGLKSECSKRAFVIVDGTALGTVQATLLLQVGKHGVITIMLPRLTAKDHGQAILKIVLSL